MCAMAQNTSEYKECAELLRTPSRRSSHSGDSRKFISKILHRRRGVRALGRGRGNARYICLIDGAVSVFRSWLRSPDGSAQLVDADLVARGVADGAVANPVGLLGRLLDNLGAAGLKPREGAVEVSCGQDDSSVGALGHHLGDGAALVVGDAGASLRRIQDDRRTGLVGGADCDPAPLASSEVVADLEAEGVAVEGQGCVRVVVREEGLVNGDVHGGPFSEW